MTTKDFEIMMTCRLFDDDAFYFAQPIADLPGLDQLYVFRDKESKNYHNITYVKPGITKPTYLKFLHRIYQMLTHNMRNVRLIIGIYEIPHGLIAMITGVLRRRPYVLCIIGNPAYAPLRSGLRKRITNLIIRKAAFVTTTGTKSRAYVVSQGVPERKVLPLPNSIDMTYFKPDETEKKYDIISLGRLSPEKRILEFVEIIGIIKKSIPAIKVAIGGDGPERDKIKARIVELGLEQNISMLGYVKNNDLVEFFNQGKVFMICSETEGFPRTIIEAMACGTPCISPVVGDITDLITDNKTGNLVFQPSNLEEYAGKTVKLLNDKELYQNIRVTGLKQVRLKYSHQAARETWLNILQGVKR